MVSYTIKDLFLQNFSELIKKHNSYFQLKLESNKAKLYYNTSYSGKYICLSLFELAIDLYLEVQNNKKDNCEI